MSSYDESQNERVIANVNKLTRKRPDPPRGLRVLAAGGIQWDAPISDAFTHYRIYVNGDADSNLAREISKGQTQVQDLVAFSAFVSAYNQPMNLESERVAYPFAVASDYARLSLANVFTKIQTIAGTFTDAQLRLHNTTPVTGADVLFWAQDAGGFVMRIGAGDIFTFTPTGGLDYFAGRAGGANLMTIRNGASDAYSGADLLDNGGTRRAFIAWGNTAAPARPLALGIGTAGAHEIIFVVNNVDQVKFDTSGNLIPVTAGTKQLGLLGTPFDKAYMDDGFYVVNAGAEYAKLVYTGVPARGHCIVIGSGNGQIDVDGGTATLCSITMTSPNTTHQIYAQATNVGPTISLNNFKIAGIVPHIDGTALGAALQINGSTSINGEIILNPGAVAGNSSVIINAGRLDGPTLIVRDASGTTTSNGLELRTAANVIYFKVIGGSDAAAPGVVVAGGYFGTTAGGNDLGSTGNHFRKLWVNDIDFSTAILKSGTQVLTARKTGWSAATGTATRTSFDTATVLLPQLAERLKALLDDLLPAAGHGLIGA